MANATNINDPLTRFFKGVPITYNAERDTAKTLLTLKHRGESTWQHGRNHEYGIVLKVSWWISPDNVASDVQLSPDNFDFGFTREPSFSGLFKTLHGYAGPITDMLSHSRGPPLPDVNDVRRCFYSLEDQVTADFENPEFVKYFYPKR
ncbi:MAG: hypothetical protein KJ879_01955 [Nanoarchaeota archaeon]|nr:hypothetical protein [Nanoarchaeota archaeon]